MSLIFIIASTGSSDQSNKIDRNLLEKLNSDEEVKVIVWIDKTEYKNSKALLLGKIRYEYDIIPAIAISIEGSKLKDLAKQNFVKRIREDHKLVFFRIESIQLIKSNSARLNFEVNGSFINISIVDTGVYNHTEFQNPNRIVKGTVCSGPPFVCDDTANYTDDKDGHGTHVAGIAAGINGVANSSIFAVKVGNFESDMIAGIEWSVKNKANIISLSMGVSNSEGQPCYNYDSSIVVDNAVESGVVVVVAAGNSGPNLNTTSAPACAKRAIAVGATYDKNYVGNINYVTCTDLDPAQDSITCFSSRGPTYDNRTKPDLVAPGAIINSTNNSLTGYREMTGTSMSTPFVSGVAALLLEKYNKTFGYFPEPDRVKAILLTAVNTTGMSAAGYTQRNNVFGSGRIDAYEALRIVSYTKNDTIAQGQEKEYYINISESKAKVTLYWPENSTINNNLDLLVGNSTYNYSYPTDANDTVEQVFLYNVNNGIWKVHVNGTKVVGEQKFYLASSVPFVEFITIESPKNKSYSYTNIHFNMTVSKAIYNAWVEINNTANYTLFNDTSTHYYNVSISLPEGFHNATFYANDTGGSIITKRIYFTVDLTKPLILIQTPANSTTYNDSEIPLNFTVTDDFGISWCGYSLNNEANKTLANCQNITLTLNDATHNITVYANDTAGNMNSSTVIFTVASPPKYFINRTNATNNIVGKYGSILLFANWTDNDGLGFAWLWTNETGDGGKNYTDSTYGSPIDINLTQSQTWSNFSWSNSSAELGSVIAWKIYANDTTGKENATATGLFIIDNSKPKYSNPKSTSPVYNSDFQANITWQDDTLHTVIFEANFTNSTPTDELPYNFTNYTVTTKEGSEYYFTILAGNQTPVGKFVVYRWYANDTSNLWNFTDYFNYTVTKAPTETKLFLNGTESNKTYIRGDKANITATINVTGKNVTIEANFTGSAQIIARGTNNATNITDTANLKVGVYNITAYFTGDENYAASSKTYFLTVSTLADGSSCTSNIQCTNGYCCHNYCRNACPYCGDGYCDSGESCSADNPSCPSGYVCTDGCVAAIPSAPLVITEETKVISLIKAGSKATVFYNQTDALKIQAITIEVKRDVSNVSITVKESSKPLNAPDPGIVYKYVEIIKANIQDEDINKAIIKFQVSKSWIIAKGVDEENISLNRWVNKWEKLPTKKLIEDGINVYYEAESPGLSVFAITGEKAIVKQACPFECCINETNYTDKLCPSGYECKNNKCLALVITKECSVCPNCTSWSECINNKQNRTCYRCSKETNYTCQAYTETKACEEVKIGINILFIVGIVSVVIMVLLFIFKFSKTSEEEKWLKLYEKYRKLFKFLLFFLCKFLF